MSDNSYFPHPSQNSLFQEHSIEPLHMSQHETKVDQILEKVSSMEEKIERIVLIQHHLIKTLRVQNNNMNTVLHILKGSPRIGGAVIEIPDDE